MNIISLAKTRKVIARDSDVANNSNPHLAINNIIEVFKWVQLLLKDGILEIQFGRKCDAKISDLFVCETAKMETGISLHQYWMCIKENWNKAPSYNDLKSNESDKIDLDNNNEEI